MRRIFCLTYFAAVMTAAPASGFQPAQTDTFITPELLGLADANGDGGISFEELQAVFPTLTREIFELLDQNGDGVLNLDDLPSEDSSEDPLLLLRQLLRELDMDGDGEVTLTEIQSIIPDFPQEAFDSLDRDGDGVLSEADLPRTPPPSARETFLRILREADSDDDGSVSFDELARIAPDVRQRRFDELDRNGDGLLEEDDLPPYPADDTDHLVRILREADEDGDGLVTFEELQALVPTLTEEQFDRLDRNGDGFISGGDAPEPPVNPRDRLIQRLRAADVDENGVVTFEELLAVAPELTREQFDRLDRDGNGEITRDDFDEPIPDPRRRFLELLRTADADGDGLITFEELQAVLPALTAEAYAQLDRNGDGTISLDDLPDTPVPEVDGPRTILLRALVAADLNHDGALEFSELAAAFPDAPSELLAHIDTNGDWVITRDELMALLSRSIDGRELIAPEDVDADGVTGAVDIQITVNHALGIFNGILLSDVTGSGQVEAADIQSVVLAILSAF